MISSKKMHYYLIEQKVEKLRQIKKFTVTANGGKHYLFELGELGAISLTINGEPYNLLNPGSVLYDIAAKKDFITVRAYHKKTYQRKNFLIINMFDYIL